MSRPCLLPFRIDLEGLDFFLDFVDSHEVLVLMCTMWTLGSHNPHCRSILVLYARQKVPAPLVSKSVVTIFQESHTQLEVIYDVALQIDSDTAILNRSIVYSSNSQLTSSIKGSFQISTVSIRDTLFLKPKDYITSLEVVS